MESPHYRKIDLQSPLDLTYLHNNTLNQSRQKLNLHLPPSANSNNDPEPDPMRERVRDLVDHVRLLLSCPALPCPAHSTLLNNHNTNQHKQFITQTFQSATPSITINGLDAPSFENTVNEALTTRETIEYEPYDTRLAGKVTALYAQLESLTTAVAKLRKEAPQKAANGYADMLKRALEEDEGGDWEEGSGAVVGEGKGREEGDDVEMRDSSSNGPQNGPQRQESSSAEHREQGEGRIRDDWKLKASLGNETQASLWREGDMAEVYEEALQTLLRLQGEVVSGDEVEDGDGDEGGSNALATTVGKAERAGRAVEVVENM